MSIVGLVLTFLFGASSIYLYFKSRRFKQVVFTGLFSRLQTRNHPDISISFKGTDINNLSKFLVLCWNGGTEEIRKSDIPSNEYPSIVFSENHRVLSYKLLEQSTPGIDFDVEQLNDRTLDLKFEYLNPKDGGLIEMLYENFADGPTTVNLNARIIGGQETLERKYGRGSSGLALLIIAFVGAAIVTSLGFSLLIRGNISSLAGTVRVIVGSLELLFAAVCIYFSWRGAKSYWSRRVPEFAVKYFEGRS